MAIAKILKISNFFAIWEVFYKHLLIRMRPPKSIGGCEAQIEKRKRNHGNGNKITETRKNKITETRKNLKQLQLIQSQAKQ